MKAIRTLDTPAALLALLPLLLTQIAAAAQPLIAGQTSLAANAAAGLPFLSQGLFPLVGLVAAVTVTQLLHRRRVLQLKALNTDRS